MFLKKRKYIEKRVIRNIINNLESFSDDSDDFDEEEIKAIKLMFLEKTIFERPILKIYSAGCLSNQWSLMVVQASSFS